MSRSGYGDYDNWEIIKWRGQVASAMRGKRGQAFLREMRDALDALPVKRLLRDELAAGREVCAIGAVGARRGIAMADIDPEDHDTIAARFGIAHAMACEIMYENDEREAAYNETPEQRFVRMRKWVEAWTS